MDERLTSRKPRHARNGAKVEAGDKAAGETEAVAADEEASRIEDVVEVVGVEVPHHIKATAHKAVGVNKVTTTTVTMASPAAMITITTTKATVVMATVTTTTTTTTNGDNTTRVTDMIRTLVMTTVVGIRSSRSRSNSHKFKQVKISTKLKLLQPVAQGNEVVRSIILISGNSLHTISFFFTSVFASGATSVPV